MDNETKQIRPQHYKDCSIECIDNMLLVFGVKETMGFCCMNAYKYLYRHLYKNREQDIYKAATYLALCENIWEKYNDYDMPEQYYVLEKLVQTESDKYKNGEY